MHDVQRREVSRTELNAEQEGSPSCVHANQGWRSKQPPGRPTEGAAGALGDLRRNLLTAKFMRLVTKTTELRNLYSEYMFNIVIRERRRAWGGGGRKKKVEEGERRKKETEEEEERGGRRTTNGHQRRPCLEVSTIFSLVTMSVKPLKFGKWGDPA